MPEQVDLWLARLHAYTEETRELLSKHMEQPWHASFTVMHGDIMHRLDRMEATLLGVAKWMIGALFLIVGVLAAILGVAWKILETKPPT